MASYACCLSSLFTAPWQFDCGVLQLSSETLEVKYPTVESVLALSVNSLSCACDWHPGGSLLQPD